MGQGKAEVESSATVITNQLMNIDTSVKMKINESCRGDSTQNNVINIVGSKVKNLTVSQKNQLELLCSLQAALDTSVSNDIQNKIMTAVAQTAEAKGGSLLGGDALSKNVSNIQNTSITNIYSPTELETAKDCLLDIKQGNIINIINSDVDSGNYNQINDAILKCLQGLSSTVKNETKATADTSTDVTQKGKAEGGTPFESSASAGVISAVLISSLLSFLVPLFIPSSE